MKTRLFLTALVLVLATGFVSAAGSKEKEPAEKKASGIVAVSLPAQDNPLMLAIGEDMKKAFPELRVEVASAEGSPNTQAAQIQNYIAMNVDMIVLMPTEAGALVEVLKEARANGIKVFVTGAKMDEAAYDSMAAVNQYLVGQYCSLMAKRWVNERYPDAAPGSIETLILTSSQNEEAVKRSMGMLSIAEPYRKNDSGEYIDADNKVVSEASKVANPVFCGKIKIVSAVDAEMSQAAQVATQNAFTQYPNIKLIITYTSDGAAGASQIIEDMGLSQEEKDAMAVFGCGLIGPEAGMLVNAEKTKGVFRGATAFGGKDLPGDMARIARQVYSGSFEKDIWDPISLVYSVNGEIRFNQVPNTGAVQDK
jgi:ABC-type sugar transport system substrate-binding protein